MVFSADQQRVISLYKPEFRLVTAFNAIHPTFKGVARVPGGLYTTTIMDHLTAPSAGLCMNQASYLAFAQWAIEQQYEVLPHDLDDFLQYMAQDMLLTDTETTMHFRKPIRLDKPIGFTGRIERIRPTRGYGMLSFDFEKGAAKGEFKFWFKAPDTLTEHI